MFFTVSIEENYCKASKAVGLIALIAQVVLGCLKV
jgi:hypothetical protein